MNKINIKNNLLAVRIEPWQLFRFKKYVEFRKSRPSIVIQEILQIYFSSLNIPKETVDSWLDEYHLLKKEGDL